MDSRERVIAALRHKPTDRVPRDLWSLPGTRLFRADELAAMLRRFPTDFAEPLFMLGRGEREEGVPRISRTYTDAWGSVWHVAQPGVIGEVKEPVLSDWGKLTNYKPPYEILDNADFTAVNRSCRESSNFVLAPSTVRPFERMQFLRGSEALYVDLICDTANVRTLLDMLHDFYLRELAIWSATGVDGVTFMDDWGSQNSLLISPSMWRDIFKPLYRDYCQMLHDKGKYVFFHTDGNVTEILGDLIEVGIDAVNSQLFCMNIEEIAERYRGKVTFWGEIDRQHILPFGTADEVRAAVRRVRNALDSGTGGVIAQCEWGLDVPAENIAAVFDEWLRQH